MKQIVSKTLVLVTVLAAINLASAADPVPGGEVDFGKIRPPATGGQFVEVNLRENLLALAARLTEAQEPQVAQVLRGLKAVRVNVVGLDPGNREEVVQRIAAIRGQLVERGWDRIVTTQQQDQDVAVFLKLRGAEAIEGITVTLLEGNREAVLVNVVGDIRPEQLTLLGERFDLEPLKKIGPAVKKS
ncbi:MAG: DUF4252 domain-containing protein [Verrucomicrobia bacterium]|jgi:hypothetical protein|nr:DUF4252 domain-containing protein [Verrucomicrobiota bacterium]